MFSWMSRRKEFVGLDIGTSSVKAVQLQRSRKKYRLVELGIAPLHPDTIVDGLIMDADTVSNAIRRMFEESRIDVKDVAVSVSGHSVIVKKITVPQMKAEELRGGIAWEAEQHIPYSIEDVNLDFQILGTGDNGKGEMDVLLVAVKKDIVNQYLAVISAAGLRAAVVDVDAFAMENAFEMSEQMRPDEVVALVNIGAAITTINVLRRGCSDFTRDSALAGNRYTESLQKGLGLSYEQAGEIRRSFEFYRSSMPGGAIDRVVLSGGCARLPDLPSYLSHALELPVEIANPLRDVTADPKKFDPEYLSFIAPQMAVGVGLALREPGDQA
jgi:type IV pilus assembly protein PilM